MLVFAAPTPNVPCCEVCRKAVFAPGETVYLLPAAPHEDRPALYYCRDCRPRRFAGPGELPLPEPAPLPA